jgi:hypothetical protein
VHYYFGFLKKKSIIPKGHMPRLQDMSGVNGQLFIKQLAAGLLLELSQAFPASAIFDIEHLRNLKIYLFFQVWKILAL